MDISTRLMNEFTAAEQLFLIEAEQSVRYKLTRDNFPPEIYEAMVQEYLAFGSWAFSRGYVEAVKMLREVQKEVQEE